MDETDAVPSTTRLRHLWAALWVGAVLVVGVAAGVVPGLGLSPASAGVVAQQVEGTGPEPVGRALPPTSQRVADSIIMIVLLLVLAGALVAVFTTARWNRRRAEGPAAES